MIEYDRTPLPVGAEIMLAGKDSKGNRYDKKFKITGVLGWGASSIVYNAVRLDNMQLAHNIVLKEFYPLKEAPHIKRHRENHSLIFHSPDAAAFVKQQKRFLAGYVKHTGFQLETRDSTIEAQDVFEGNNTVYIVLEEAPGTTLDRCTFSTLGETITVTSNLLRALKQYHNRGKLHLDIKPENIFVFHDRRVALFDFDSVQEKAAVQKGQISYLLYSDSWAAPELRRKELQKLAESADLYSVGAVFFYLVMQRLPYASDRKHNAKWDLKGASPFCSQVPDTALSKLKEIFARSLPLRISSRYLQVGDFIADLEELQRRLNSSAGITHASFYELSKAVRTEAPEYRRLYQSQPAGEAYLQLFVSGEAEEGAATLDHALQRLWGRDFCHVSLTGEGGAGKTTALLKLWEQLTSEYDPELPVPIYFQLSSYPGSTPARTGYIKQKLISYYQRYQDTREDLQEGLLKLMNSPLTPAKGSRRPAVILLLDGLNEAGPDSVLLRQEIRELLQEMRGLQVVLSSRSDDREASAWRHLGVAPLTIQPLTRAQINRALENSGAGTAPLNEKFLSILANPMMLSLYLSSNTLINTMTPTEQEGFSMKASSSRGEILYNYLQTQLLRKSRQVTNPEGVELHSFLLNHILPYLAYYYLKMDTHAMGGKKLQALINYAYHHSTSFRRLYPLSAKTKSTLLCLKKDADLKTVNKSALVLHDIESPFVNERRYDSYIAASAERFHKIADDILGEELFFLKKNAEGDYTFTHHHFRDFFAALYITREIELSLNSPRREENLPSALSDFYLPPPVRTFVGEILGEHRNSYQLQGESYILVVKEKTLSSLLDLCRGLYLKAPEDSLSYRDLLHIIRHNRFGRANIFDFYTTYSDIKASKMYFEKKTGFLQGLDLHQLAKLYQRRSKRGQVQTIIYNIVNIFNDIHGELSGRDLSRLDLSMLSMIGYRFSKRHQDNYLTAAFSGSVLDGYENFIAYALLEIEDFANCRYYNSKDDRILVTGGSFVRELDLITGKTEPIYEHSCRLRHATYHEGHLIVYDEEGKKTVLNRKTLKPCPAPPDMEWNSKIFWAYRPTLNIDGKKILRVEDEFILELKRETKEVINSYHVGPHSKGRAIYSADFKRIIFGDPGRTLQVFDTLTGERLSEYPDASYHSQEMINVELSPDGTRLLFTARDFSIKEWDLQRHCCRHLYQLPKEATQGQQKIFSQEEAAYACYDLTGSAAICNLLADGQKQLFATANGQLYNEPLTEELLYALKEAKPFDPYISFHPSRQKVLFPLNGHYHLYDYTLDSLIKLKVEGQPLLGAAFSVDGRIVAATADSTLAYLALDNHPGSIIETYSLKEYVEFNQGPLRIIESPAASSLIIHDRETAVILIRQGAAYEAFYFSNANGLLLQGCDLSQISPHSALDDDYKEMLHDYGALF